jgi:3-oxoacyl-[acyl-carrier protein] reductase
LTGKVAIVTGSGRGLGLAYARRLASDGAAVVVNDVDADVTEQAAASLRAEGGRAVAVAAGVGPTAAAQQLVDAALAEFGRLDALVANAGVLRDRVLWKMTDDDFDTVIEVHLRGTFTTARAAVAAMRAQGEGGRLILVGSPAGQYGNFGQTNYSAAKAGIVAFAKVWAMELARDKITANAVVPVAATAMTATVPFLQPYVDALEAGDPLPAFARRELGFGTPDDVAGLVAFLTSDAAAGITGQAIGIGGDRLSLYAHPSPVVQEYADGGWTEDAIAAAWPARFAPHQQPVGELLPKPPSSPDAAPSQQAQR